MNNPSAIAHDISAALGQNIDILGSRHTGGGSINQTLTLQTSAGNFFVKLNQAGLLDMFKAEQAGLAALSSAESLRIPAVIACGADREQSWLVLEYIPLGHGGSQGMARAGQALAAMHRKTQQQFGWERDNTIGSTPQPNQWHSDWISFWQQQRLGFQLQVAEQNGYRGEVIELGEKLASSCGQLLEHNPAASLLHGDLWSGNMAFDQDHQPVIYDPAVYYGDRETDLAMTELFGGFSTDFYAAYREHWPIDPGYQQRRKLYNLYHVLNHMNLFGGGYQSQAISMTRQLLGEIQG